MAKRPAKKKRGPVRPHAKKKAEARVLSLEELWALDVRQRVTDDCHPWQLGAVEDPSLLISILVGRGGGKTTSLRARALIKLTSIRRGRLVYIATTRTQAEELMWEPLKASIEFYGLSDEFTFNESKLRVTCKRTGATYRLVGADNKKEIEKLRGQPFDEVQIDEAASFPPELLDALLDRIVGPRIGERNGVIVLAGTPGHILRGPFYDATRIGATAEDGTAIHRPYADRDLPEWAEFDGWSSHAWSLEDVVKLPEAAERFIALVNLWAKALRTKKRKGWSDTNPIWLREYLGRWAADDTTHVFAYRPHLVLEVDGKEVSQSWNQWDPARAGALQLAVLPKAGGPWHAVIAMDKGFHDEFAVNAYVFSPTDPDKNVFHVFAFEQTKMHARPLAELLLGDARDHLKPAGLIGALGGWPDGMIADADDAFLLELANVYGLKVVKAKKERDYKAGAIELTNGDLVDGRIKVLKGSPLEKQLQSLQWKENAFGLRQEDKSQANHSTDTLIYGRRLIADLFEAGVVDQEADAAAKPAIDRGFEPHDLRGDRHVDLESLLAEPEFDESDRDLL